jgi:hypothetical protein
MSGLAAEALAARLRRGYALERMRSRSSSRSKSAMPAMIVAIMRPCGVDRSKAKPFSDDRHAPVRGS